MQRARRKEGDFTVYRLPEVWLYCPMTLTDHQLNIIVAICAILALIISIAIYFLQKGKKSLSFRIVSLVNLLSQKEELEGKVKIFYETTEVKNLQVLTISFINSGKIAIMKSDFVVPEWGQYFKRSDNLDIPWKSENKLRQFPKHFAIRSNVAKS